MEEKNKHKMKMLCKQGCMNKKIAQHGKKCMISIHSDL